MRCRGQRKAPGLLGYDPQMEHECRDDYSPGSAERHRAIV
jgi:hypothetical protein